MGLINLNNIKIFMMHPREERTYVMIKPDGVMKGAIGETLKRFEQRGLKIVGLDMYMATREQVDGHYPKNEEWITRLGHKTLATYEKYGIDPIAEIGTDKPEEIGPSVRNWLLDYLTMGPVVRIVVEGVHAVDVVRKIAGSTMPYQADMGTIRGDYSIDSPALANKEKRSVMNILHASETPEEAEHEIKYWFGDKEILKYNRMSPDQLA